VLLILDRIPNALRQLVPTLEWDLDDASAAIPILCLDDLLGPFAHLTFIALALLLHLGPLFQRLCTSIRRLTRSGRG
jgi:hypothetical protein